MGKATAVVGAVAAILAIIAFATQQFWLLGVAVLLFFVAAGLLGSFIRRLRLQGSARKGAKMTKQGEDFMS
jgi:hypothetical protein